MDHASAADLMKDAFRRYPTGVAVITATGPEGPVGLTASSVASASVAPPAVSFSVMGTQSARRLLQAPAFVIHLLGARHAELAKDFSRTGGPRFTPAQGWRFLPSGEPLLTGALAALRGAPMHLLPVGDAATVVVASVTEVLLGPDDDRLIYHARQFVTAPSSPERTSCDCHDNA